jgi:hypothetical protein
MIIWTEGTGREKKIDEDALVSRYDETKQK